MALVTRWCAFRPRRLAQSVGRGSGPRNLSWKFQNKMALVTCPNAFWLRRLAQKYGSRLGPQHDHPGSSSTSSSSPFLLGLMIHDIINLHLIFRNINIHYLHFYHVSPHYPPQHHRFPPPHHHHPPYHPPLHLPHYHPRPHPPQHHHPQHHRLNIIILNIILLHLIIIIIVIIIIIIVIIIVIITIIIIINIVIHYPPTPPHCLGSLAGICFLCPIASWALDTTPMSPLDRGAFDSLPSAQYVAHYTYYTPPVSTRLLLTSPGPRFAEGACNHLQTFFLLAKQLLCDLKQSRFLENHVRFQGIYVCFGWPIDILHNITHMYLHTFVLTYMPYFRSHHITLHCITLHYIAITLHYFTLHHYIT